MSTPDSTEAKASAALKEAQELAKRAAEHIRWLLTHTMDGKPK